MRPTPTLRKPELPEGFKSAISAVDREQRIAAAWSTVKTRPASTPRCPKCHVPMRPLASKALNPFWGCPNFPACTKTLPPSGQPRANFAIGRKARRRVRLLAG